MSSSASGLCVVVATHKAYQMPEDDAYLPLQVGAAGRPSLGFRRDDEGSGISDRNPHYCELTGLYWAWKNTTSEYLGLVHYRRLFKGSRGIASGAELLAKLQDVDVLVPRPRNYFIESNYSQYAHAHHAQDLDETRAILSERHADYLPAYDAVMKSTKGHRFNMFVMRRQVLESYCAWLFDVLFELERRLDISDYSTYDARVFGFVSERLLDVWLTRNGIRFTELPVLNLESQHWPTKILNFLRRKFSGKGAR